MFLFLKEIISARIFSLDLDRTIVLRQLSLESQMICSYSIVVASLYYSILVLHKCNACIDSSVAYKTKPHTHTCFHWDSTAKYLERL